MTCIVRRFAVLFMGGLMCLVLPATAAKAQTRPHTFEIAAGTQYGVPDSERPVTPGWIVSSGFALGRQVFVVEGAWHRDAYVLEHFWDVDEVFRENPELAAALANAIIREYCFLTLNPPHGG